MIVSVLMCSPPTRERADPVDLRITCFADRSRESVQMKNPQKLAAAVDRWAPPWEQWLLAHAHTGECMLPAWPWQSECTFLCCSLKDDSFVVSVGSSLM